METRKISERDAYFYASESYIMDDLDFEIVNTELTDSDEEDGGGHYVKILKEKSTDKLFRFSYCDWDIYNTDYDEEEDVVGDRCDLETDLKEVKAKKTTTTVYK